jgi:hypothetical protein
VCGNNIHGMRELRADNQRRRCTTCDLQSFNPWRYQHGEPSDGGGHSRRKYYIDLGPECRSLTHFGTLGSATSREIEPLLRAPYIVHIYYITTNSGCACLNGPTSAHATFCCITLCLLQLSSALFADAETASSLHTMSTSPSMLTKVRS